MRVLVQAGTALLTWTSTMIKDYPILSGLVIGAASAFAALAAAIATVKITSGLLGLVGLSWAGITAKIGALALAFSPLATTAPTFISATVASMMSLGATATTVGVMVASAVGIMVAPLPTLRSRLPSTLR